MAYEEDEPTETERKGWNFNGNLMVFSEWFAKDVIICLGSYRFAGNFRVACECGLWKYATS